MRPAPGNDFGRGNKTYLNVPQGFRPVRYLGVASPFGKLSPANNPDPTKYLACEAGVHGWPAKGFYYDVSVFQINVRDRVPPRGTGRVRRMLISPEVIYTRARCARKRMPARVSAALRSHS
ncbi:MAG TPA: hypothetical protein VFN79_11255 [Steroidobacteraceae bacterium]|nr:hypothetical protein [Steroidobacteraceae bacterium]